MLSKTCDERSLILFFGWGWGVSILLILKRPKAHVHTESSINFFLFFTFSTFSGQTYTWLVSSSGNVGLKYIYQSVHCTRKCPKRLLSLFQNFSSLWPYLYLYVFQFLFENMHFYHRQLQRFLFQN